MMHKVSRLTSTANHMLLCDIAMRRPLVPALTMCHVANVVVASRQIKGDGACKLDGSHAKLKSICEDDQVHISE